MRPVRTSPWREYATLIQQSPGTRSETGHWLPGVETATSVLLVSAPPSGSAKRDVLPEGARLSDLRQFWLDQTARPLRVGEGQTDGDVIVYGGVRYRVRYVEDWGPDGCIEALGVREEGQSDQSADTGD